MKNIAMGALLLTVFGLSSPALAAGNAVSTTMQVSFVVQESCTVQAPDGSRTAPTVACAHAAPVQVSAATAAAVPSTTAASPDGWQIYF